MSHKINITWLNGIPVDESVLREVEGVIAQHTTECTQDFSVLVFRMESPVRNRLETALIDGPSFFLCTNINDYAVVIPDQVLDMSTLISLWDSDYVEVNELSFRITIQFF